MNRKSHSFFSYLKTTVDEESFRRIVESYGKKIYNIALYTVQDERDAEDIAQEVFVKIYKGLSGFRGEARLSTWIYRITKNACFNHLRREKKYREMDDLNSMQAVHQGGNMPESEYLRREEHGRVRDAVKRLPPNPRMAISLYYFHGRSYSEIASIMNLPLNTVKSHIHRAKKSLASSLLKTTGKRHE